MTEYEYKMALSDALQQLETEAEQMLAEAKARRLPTPAGGRFGENKGADQVAYWVAQRRITLAEAHVKATRDMLIEANEAALNASPDYVSGYEDAPDLNEPMR